MSTPLMEPLIHSHCLGSESSDTKNVVAEFLDDRRMIATVQSPLMIHDMIISPRSQWEEYICPHCDELMDDPVLTFCGHRMCYDCFNMRRRKSICDPWCPVRDEDGQEHKMSRDDWSRDRTAEWKINKLLVKCEKCKVECTVKRYKKFDCSTGHDAGINSILISPRSQWKEYICPDCGELMEDPVLTSCGHRMCYKCFDEKRRNSIFDLWCPVSDDDGQGHEMSRDDYSEDRTAEWKINRLLVKCMHCKVECTVKRYRKYTCSTDHCKGINSLLIGPRSQWEECICPDCDELMNDPVQTSCGHRMCCKCFDKRKKNYRNMRCPAQDDDDYQEHEMTWDYWYKDKAVEKKINKLLMKCDKCEAKCTVEEYRKYHATSIALSQEQTDGLCRFLVNDCKENLPHWKKILSRHDGSELSRITDDELFRKALQSPTGKCAPFVLCLRQCSCSKCEYLLNMLSDLSVVIDDEEASDIQQSPTADAVYAKLASIKTFQELEKVPLDLQQKLITQVLKEALPSAKNDLKLEEIRHLLRQNGVITGEEAIELLGIFTGEEKITRLYTKMLPNKGMDGLKKYMEVLLDTGLKTPSHMRHLGVLSTILSAKLEQIDNESILYQYESIEAAREAIVPMVYSESLPDAVINLSMTIDKLLIPMLKRRLVTTMEFFWLRQTFCPGEKVKELYEVFLPQKGVKGLKAFMEVLQDVGRKTPKYQNHRDLLKSTLQVQLSKF